MLLDQIASLLPSSRPRWANMPKIAATPFADMLLFVCAVLDQLGIENVIHYGSLLGAARLGSPLPWDEDHDLFVVDVDLSVVREQIEPILRAHGYRIVADPRGFLWVKERFWVAGSGHLAIDILPPLIAPPDKLPVWPGGAPHMWRHELRPLRRLPFCGSFLWAPCATEAVLARLYGETGSIRTMARFSPVNTYADVVAFWTKARSPIEQNWSAISHRFRSRSRWRYLMALPWWWFNGGYVLAINGLKNWSRRKREADRAA